MKAAQLIGPRRFAFTEIDAPRPDIGEVLVRTEFTSICGSDLRHYDRTFAEEEYPLAPGQPCHEVAGIIEESRDDRFQPGQRVIALRNASLTEYAAVPADEIVAVPDAVLRDPSLWVLCQPIGTVLFALQEAGSVLGKRVVILGQGPIGLAFTEFVSRAGARQVIVSDRHDYRLEKARSLGATHTINATRVDPLDAITEYTKGEMADVVIEAAGRPETANLIFQAIKIRGLAVVFGLAHDENVFPFDWAQMALKVPRIVVTNSSRSGPGERARSVGALVDLVTQGRFDLAPYLTHQLPWQDVAAAYEIYSNKTDNSLKVVMKVS